MHAPGGGVHVCLTHQRHNHNTHKRSSHRTRKKNVRIHKKKKKYAFTHKKKSTLQHQYARMCVRACVRACVLISAQHACISTKTYNDQHRTHIPYTHQRYARTCSKTKHQRQHKKYTNQHHTHIPEKKRKCANHQKKRRKMHPPAPVQHARTWWCCACVYVCGSTCYSHPPR